MTKVVLVYWSEKFSINLTLAEISMKYLKVNRTVCKNK